MEKKYFGLYKGVTLFYTNGGSFAASAWLASGGENCGDVLGTNFRAITADDGIEYNIGKKNVSPVKEEDLPTLFDNAHPALKLTYELDRMKTKNFTKSMEYQLRRNLIPELLKEYSYEEVKEFFVKEYMFN